MQRFERWNLHGAQEVSNLMKFILNIYHFVIIPAQQFTYYIMSRGFDFSSFLHLMLLLPHEVSLSWRARTCLLITCVNLQLQATMITGTYETASFSFGVSWCHRFICQRQCSWDKAWSCHCRFWKYPFTPTGALFKCYFANSGNFLFVSGHFHSHASWFNIAVKFDK